MEGFGDCEGEEDYEEGGREDLEVDELFRGSEAGVEGADVGLIGQREVSGRISKIHEFLGN